jgi:hypothetical protein
MKSHRKMPNQYLKSLGDETGICLAAMLLMSQRNVGTYGTQDTNLACNMVKQQMGQNSGSSP